MADKWGAVRDGDGGDGGGIWMVVAGDD